MTTARQRFSKSRGLNCAMPDGSANNSEGDVERPGRRLFAAPRVPLGNEHATIDIGTQKIVALTASGRRRKTRDALKLTGRLKKPMTYESSPRRRLNLPSFSEPATELAVQEGEHEWRGVVSVLSAVDELGSSASMDLMLRQSIEVARECIGLERVGLYLTEPTNAQVLRGTWGTGSFGETTDERDVAHEFAPTERQRLLDAHKTGTRWLYFDHVDHIAQEPGRSVVIGQGWLVVTPLVADGDLVGVLFNDTAFTHNPIDLGRQVRAAVFCSLLAGLIVGRRKVGSMRPAQRETERGSVVRQIQRSLNLNPLVSGEHLARELNISAGYLARVFKTEVGVSLVEYRNRLRIERFLRLVERGGGNLYEAAIEAGFGSYAQFHRVFRRHVGTTPREYVTGTQSSPTNPIQERVSNEVASELQAEA